MFAVTPDLVEERLRVSSNHLMLDLLGQGDIHLKAVEESFPQVVMVARGNEVRGHRKHAGGDKKEILMVEAS